MKTGSLFSGYGGLDLAVEQHFGAETVWCSDIDPGATKIMAHRWPHIPNHGDITKIDWYQVEPVHIVVGGWPCQPFSPAGKRLGAADERALWPEVARAVRALRPNWVVLENVSAITAVELGRATADLAGLGYVGQWRSIRASDIGAPHRRNRIFIVATDTESNQGRLSNRNSQPATDSGGETLRQRPRLREGEPGRIRRRRPSDDTAPTVSDADDQGLERRNTQSERRNERATRPGSVEPAADAGRFKIQRRPIHRGISDEEGARECASTPTDTDSLGCGTGTRSAEPGSDGFTNGTRRHGKTAWGAYEPAIRRWETLTGRPAPAPTDLSRNGGRRLSARFVEWMMGLPEGWVCDVPDLTRNAQLKALGNGVVPQQAFTALTLMKG